MSATIAARAHSSASLSAPARRRAPARRKTSWMARLLRSAAQRPGRALILLVFAMVATAILANALLLQKARHPAPLAAAPAEQAAPRQSERRAEPPASITAPAPVPAPTMPAILPPARPNDLSQNAREASPRPPAAVTNVARTAPAPAPASAPAVRAAAPRDPIADLINGPDIRPPGEIRGVAAARSPRRTAEN